MICAEIQKKSLVFNDAIFFFLINDKFWLFIIKINKNRWKTPSGLILIRNITHYQKNDPVNYIFCYKIHMLLLNNNEIITANSIIIFYPYNKDKTLLPYFFFSVHISISILISFNALRLQSANHMQRYKIILICNAIC